MDKTNQFEKLAQATGMAVVEECDDAKDDVDIEETVTKPLLSPMIQHQKSTVNNQMQTTNKFSNFGFFAGSPRQTALVDVHGNIDQSHEDEIEVSIEEAIEENIE